MSPIMLETSTQTSQSASRPLLIGAAVISVALIGGTVALWAHYGSAVFYEMIVAGIAACF
jgi:hypothetical protein